MNPIEDADEAWCRLGEDSTDATAHAFLGIKMLRDAEKTEFDWFGDTNVRSYAEAVERLRKAVSYGE